MVYRFIDENKVEFGLRWICKKLAVSLTAYYNYKKNRKAAKNNAKENIKEEIKYIYYNTDRNLGHRGMQIFLARKGLILSKTTVFKYMNQELNLHAVLKIKKASYKNKTPDSTYENTLNQEFVATCKNQIWCADFTYIRLKSGKMRYNCSLIDIYDRSVVASLNSSYMTSEFAIDTLKLALKNEKISGNLLLHTDRGSQFTSYEFAAFCNAHHIRQSMSKPGCPYDNAVMERFYRTFKTEFIYKNTFYNDDDLNQKTNRYIHLWYNYLRPHSFNLGLTPLEKRFAIFE